MRELYFGLCNRSTERPAMLIKLDDAERVVHAAIINLCLKDKDTCAGDYSAYALQALRALPVSDGWEDIATAPRDGTLFLGICPTGAGHPHYMHPFVMRHEGKLHSTFQYNNGAKWVDWPKPDPTNWKPLGPLPAPPTIE